MKSSEQRNFSEKSQEGFMRVKIENNRCIEKICGRCAILVNSGSGGYPFVYQRKY